MPPANPPDRLELSTPSPLLRWLGEDPVELKLDNLEFAEIWGLVAIGTLGRVEQPAPLRIVSRGKGEANHFAHAVGLMDVVENRAPTSFGDAGRTVKLTRIHEFSEIEPVAAQTSKLLVSDASLEDVRRTIYYVLVELMRNAVQHSHDPLGGVVAAQRNDQGPNRNRPVIQVAVGDAGIGIPKSLGALHPTLTDPREALTKALWPHISGTFEEGLTGTAQNAGMGLFFIAEMAKLVAGRLVIASRGATLTLAGDPEFADRHEFNPLEPGVGFPGTLVAFEMPANETQNYEAIIETIKERARERTPKRETHRWLKFELPPPGVPKFVIKVAVEDTRGALELARKRLIPSLVQRKPVALDFINVPMCTQSYLHALLFEALRVAWALKTDIFVVNAQPAVKTNLELLENYALSG